MCIRECNFCQPITDHAIIHGCTWQSVWHPYQMHLIHARIHLICIILSCRRNVVGDILLIVGIRMKSLQRSQSASIVLQLLTHSSSTRPIKSSASESSYSLSISEYGAYYKNGVRGLALTRAHIMYYIICFWMLNSAVFCSSNCSLCRSLLIVSK